MFCDLEGCLSAEAVQLRLQSQGIRASVTQATRLLLLQRTSVRLSWSALEVLVGEAQAILRTPLWLTQPLDVSALNESLVPLGLKLRFVTGSGYQILSSDEELLEQDLADPGHQSLEFSPEKRERPSLALLPRETVSPAAWPESWQVIADSEDLPKVLEHLRQAFRAAQASGASVAPLLWLALKRRLPELTREVARLTREWIDADVGRQLEALFSLSESESLTALNYLRRQSRPSWDLTFLVGLLQILWDQPHLRLEILELLEEFTSHWLASPQGIVDWWEDLLSQVASLEALEVQKISQLSLSWLRQGLPLETSLTRRLRRGISLEERVLAAWLLAQPLGFPLGQEFLSGVIALAGHPGLKGALLIRFQQVLRLQAASVLPALLNRSVFVGLAEELRCWLVREALSFPILVREAEAYAVEELAGGSRAMLTTLAALGWTPHSESLLSHPLAGKLASCLEQELPRLQAPEDTWSLSLLMILEGDSWLRRLWNRVVREGVSRSRAFPSSLETLAQALKLAQHSGQVWPGSVEEFLPPSRHWSDRPEVYRAWARLLALGTGEDSLDWATRDFLEAGRVRLPWIWPEWWLIVHCEGDEGQRNWAQQGLFSALVQDDTPHQTVQAILQGCLARAEAWVDPERLLQCLSRRLVRLPALRSPQQQLRWALEAQGDGDGTLKLQGWGAEQRELALTLLGHLALHPELEASLRRPTRVRCWQFLLDWAQAIGRGGGSYESRNMPLWTTARRLLSQVQLEERPLVDKLGELLFELQSGCPERLRLLNHVSCLGFLLDWCCLSELSAGEALRRQRLALALLQELIGNCEREHRSLAISCLMEVPLAALQASLRQEWQHFRQRWQSWISS